MLVADITDQISNTKSRLELYLGIVYLILLTYFCYPTTVLGSSYHQATLRPTPLSLIVL